MTATDAPALHIEKLGRELDVVKMKLNANVDLGTAIPQLARAISNCFKNGTFKIILDLDEIKYPSASFIALLIELTSQARRRGGDLKLTNLAMSAKSNLSTFNPLNYLSVEDDLKIAFEEFGLTTALAEEGFEQLPTTETAIRDDEPRANATEPPEELSLSDLSITEPKIDFPPRGIKKTPAPGPARQPDARPAQRPQRITHSKQAATPSVEKGGAQRGQDIKIIRDPRNLGHRIRVKSKNESLYVICDFVTDLAQKAGFPEREIGKIKVTVYEACLNVIEHAYHSDPDEWIVVTVQQRDQDFVITIQDWGESFTFDHTKSYDVEQAMQDRRTGGFGLYIIKRSMDDVFYKTDPINGNRLILTKAIPMKG